MYIVWTKYGQMKENNYNRQQFNMVIDLAS